METYRHIKRFHSENQWVVVLSMLHLDWGSQSSNPYSALRLAGWLSPTDPIELLGVTNQVIFPRFNQVGHWLRAHTHLKAHQSNS